MRTIYYAPFIVILSILNSCSSTGNDSNSTGTEANSVDTIAGESDSISNLGDGSDLSTFVETETGTYLYGYKNKNGETAIDAQFELAWSFHNGLAPVCKGDLHGFCDVNGKITELPEGIKFAVFYNDMAGGLEFFAFSEGLILVVNEAESKYGFVNLSNELVAPCIYDNAEAFSEGYSCVYKDGKAGFIDTTGRMMIEPVYTTARSFHEGLAPVSFEDGLFGFINTSAEMVIEPKFASVEQFSDGLCLAHYPDNGGIYFIDKVGKTVIEGPFEEASYFWDGEATVKEDGKCKVIDKTGKKLRTVSCDYFELGC